MNPGQSLDLKTLLAQGGPMDPVRAVGVVRQIAAAIDDAYAHQTVHREISSATIWLGGNDAVYLSDAGTGTPSADRTRTLVTNNETTYLADIQALTAVLYECLTGHPPAQTGSDAPAPRPSQEQPGVPSGFDDVIARGLASNPDDHFRSTADLVTAAQSALPVAAPPTPSTQPTSVDTPLPRPSQDVTQTIHLPAHPPTGPPSPPAPPVAPNANTEQPQWDPRYGRSPTISYPHSRPIPLVVPQPPKRRRRLLAPVLVILAIIALVVGGAIAIPKLVGHKTSSRPSSTNATAAPRTYKSQPSALPFPGLERTKSVAVDGAGNVYVLASLTAPPDSRPFDLTQAHLFKLAPGASTPTMLDIPGVDMRYPSDMTVDQGGTIYISDRKSVWEWKPGASNPIRLPFRGFTFIEAIALDAAGNFYAAGSLASDSDNFGYGVKKLIPGDTKPTELSFPNLYQPKGLAVDRAGNIYVCAGIKGTGRGLVLKLPAGATAPLTLTIPEAKEPFHAATDSSGNLFVADDYNKGLFQIPAGSTTSIRVPMSDLTSSVAVDASGTLYVTTPALKDRSDKLVAAGQVLKLTPDR